MEVEKTGGGSHDLEVPEPFVTGGGGSSSFGDKDRSGEAVDQEVALGLPVGVHGNEAVSYTHLREVDLSLEPVYIFMPEMLLFMTIRS